MNTAFYKTDQVLATIHAVLTPYVGELMASTAAAAHCRQLGFRGSILEDSDVEVLLEKLRLGLVIFLGQEKSALVVQTMKRAIQAMDEAA